MTDNRPEENFELKAGTDIGHYQIERKIGAGGMGQVYLALDTKLNRKVAVKMLLGDFLGSDDKVKRLRREALTAAKINHANIMSIYDIGEYTDTSGRIINYIVMEYIEGDSLSAYLNKHTLSLSELLRIAEKSAAALASAHQLDIVHRDIKLDNIMINSDNEPKILDFGLAKPIEKVSFNQTGDATATVSQDLTVEGKIVGTISYMSPEQARGETVDQRSDIFSFGVLMYKLFTGQLPFQGKDNVSTIAKILEAPHPPLRQHNQMLPDELDRIINKCLQKKPGDRYQDTRDLVLDLRNLRKLTDSGVSDTVSGMYRAETQEIPAAKKKILMLPVSLTAAVVVIVVALMFFNVIPGPFGISSARADENTLAVLNFENLSDADDNERLGQIFQELIITNLSDNENARIVSSQRLFDIQKRLGYKERAKIDRGASTEVARQSGAGIMLSGNLIKKQDSWLITGQLIDVKSGTVIQSHKLEGADIYGLVDELSDKIRADLSFTDTGKGSMPDDTGQQYSIEAFRYYLEGVDLLNEYDYAAAIASFRKAVAIEPDFSQAYYKMAIANWWMDDVASSEDEGSIANILKENKYATRKDRLLAEGAVALMERRFEDGFEIYSELTKLYPDEKEAWYGLGEAKYHSGYYKREDAVGAFETAIELDPSFLLAYRHIFDVCYNAKDYQRALTIVDKLIKANPNSAAGYRFKIEIGIISDDTALFNSAFAEALQFHQSNDERLTLYLDVTRDFGEHGNVPMAGKYLQMAMKYDPDTTDYRVLTYLGIFAKEQNNLQEAKKFLERAHRDNAQNAMVLKNLIQIYSAERNYSKAIDYSSKLVKSAPENQETWQLLLYLYVSSEQYSKADSVFDEAMVQLKSNASKLNLISNLSQSLTGSISGEKMAAKILDIGLQMDSLGENNNIWSAAGQFAYKKRRYADVEKYILKIVDPDKFDKAENWGRNLLFDAYLYQKKYDQARNIAEFVANKDGAQATDFIKLIEVAVYSGNFDQVDNIVAQAHRKDPSEIRLNSLWAGVARCYNNIDEFQRAFDIVERRYQADTTNTNNIFSMGSTLESLGRLDEAEGYLEKAYEKDRRDEDYLVRLIGVNIRQNDFSTAEKWLAVADNVASNSSAIQRMHGYYLSMRRDYKRAAEYAEQALELNDGFFSYNLLGWILVAGEIDIDRGLEYGQIALDNPPASSPFDAYVTHSPYVPLPQHTVGLGYMKRGDYQKALPLLEKAHELRPDDRNILQDWNLCRSYL
ncbi:MAG: protein kinase [Candidatus Zixiibacteriota bacterium]